MRSIDRELISLWWIEIFVLNAQFHLWRNSNFLPRERTGKIFPRDFRGRTEGVARGFPRKRVGKSSSLILGRNSAYAHDCEKLAPVLEKRVNHGLSL